MVTTGKTLVEQASGTPKIASSDDAALVFDAFRGVLFPPTHTLPSTLLTILQFTRVTQQLLNILTGKADLLTSVPLVGGPVASSLRALESAVDVST